MHTRNGHIIQIMVDWAVNTLKVLILQLNPGGYKYQGHQETRPLPVSICTSKSAACGLDSAG